jgi:hypothetical protein
MITAEKLNFVYKVTGANEQLRLLRVFDDGAKPTSKCGRGLRIPKLLFLSSWGLTVKAR